jgi:hypothetical protein
VKSSERRYSGSTPISRTLSPIPRSAIAHIGVGEMFFTTGW